MKIRNKAELNLVTTMLIAFVIGIGLLVIVSIFGMYPSMEVTAELLFYIGASSLIIAISMLIGLALK